MLMLAVQLAEGPLCARVLHRTNPPELPPNMIFRLEGDSGKGSLNLYAWSELPAAVLAAEV
jgi:hypothetical protein